MNPLRVLIVEDSPTCALLVKRVIVSELCDLAEGIQIDDIADIEKAIKIAHSYDVALVDLTLEHSSRENTLRSLHHFYPVPVIVVSGHKDATTIRSSIERYGAASYIYKDLAFRDPLALVMRICEAVWRATYERTSR